MQRRDRQNAQAAATASRHNSTETSTDRRKPPHRSPLHYHSATLFDRNALRFLTGVYIYSTRNEHPSRIAHKRYYFENFRIGRNEVLEPPAASVEGSNLSFGSQTPTGPGPSLPQRMQAGLKPLFAAKNNYGWLKLQRSRSPSD